MKQTIQSLLLPITVIAAITFSCNESSLNTSEPAFKSTGTEGIVLYTGEIAVDGCEYMLQINDNLYKPLNLPTSFKVDGLAVVINYEIAKQGYQCGLSPTPKTAIKLIEIRKKK